MTSCGGLGTYLPNYINTNSIGRNIRPEIATPFLRTFSNLTEFIDQEFVNIDRPERVRKKIQKLKTDKSLKIWQNY